MNMKQIVTKSSADTEKLASQIGTRLKGGEFIELTSDLGGGKTTFVRGLARGAGSDDVVASPTFTVSKVYKTPKFEIHHLDFYRLGNNTGLISHELSELIDDPNVVIVVEWAEVLDDVMPESRVKITIGKQDNDTRQITITTSPESEYIMEGIC